MEELFREKITVKKFTGFIMPSVVMMIVLGIYYMIDSLLVSIFAGKEALATLSIAYPITGIMWGISVMLASGSSAIVAIDLGMKKEKSANERFTLICLMSVVLSAILICLSLIFMPNIVAFLGATKELERLCSQYLQIMVWGFPGAFLGVVFEYYIRVDGRPDMTLYVYLVSGAAHILVAWALMKFADMGIRGAAFGTIIGLWFTAIFGLIYFLVMNKQLRFTRPKADWNFMLHTITNGSSEFVSEASDGITTYFFNLVMLRLAGADGVAAMSIAFSIHECLLSVHIGFVTGISPLISFFYGAKKYDTVNTFLRYSRNYIIASAIIMTGVFYFGSPLIVKAFVSPGSDVYAMAVYGMKLLSPTFIAVGLNIFGSAFFTSYGNGGISALISLMRALVALTAFVFILSSVLGVTGLWLSTAAAEFATAFVALPLINKYKTRYHYSFK